MVTARLAVKLRLRFGWERGILRSRVPWFTLRHEGPSRGTGEAEEYGLQLTSIRWKRWLGGAEEVVAARKAAGVAPARVMATAPEQVSGEPGKPVTLKLGLAAK